MRQAAMGWTDSHLSEFRAGGTGWGIPDPDFSGGPLPAAKTTLFDLIEVSRSCSTTRSRSTPLSSGLMPIAAGLVVLAVLLMAAAVAGGALFAPVFCGR